MKVQNIGSLTISEIECSENTLIKFCQRQAYPDIISYFFDPNMFLTVKYLQLLGRLQCKSTNILRCGGRLDYSDLDREAKFPILLPLKSHLSKLVIAQIHNISHVGTNHVLTSLRQRWWLPRARQNIISVIRKCITCQKLQSRPYKDVDIPPLPTARVTVSRPFTVTCVDLTGA